MSTERILYTRQEAAKLLSISVRTLDSLIATKKLTARRVGRRVLLQHVELQKFSRKDTCRIESRAETEPPVEAQSQYTDGMVEDLYYKAAHYNLKYKTGALLNRITAHDLCGIRPQDVEWIWIVEEKRNATSEEIKELCKRAPKR